MDEMSVEFKKENEERRLKNPEMQEVLEGQKQMNKGRECSGEKKGKIKKKSGKERKKEKKIS